MAELFPKIQNEATLTDCMVIHTKSPPVLLHTTLCRKDTVHLTSISFIRIPQVRPVRSPFWSPTSTSRSRGLRVYCRGRGRGAHNPTRRAQNACHAGHEGAYPILIVSSSSFAILGSLMMPFHHTSIFSMLKIYRCPARTCLHFLIGSCPFIARKDFRPSLPVSSHELYGSQQAVPFSWVRMNGQ